MSGGLSETQILDGICGKGLAESKGLHATALSVSTTAWLAMLVTRRHDKSGCLKNRDHTLLERITVKALELRDPDRAVIVEHSLSRDESRAIHLSVQDRRLLPSPETQARVGQSTDNTDEWPWSEAYVFDIVTRCLHLPNVLLGEVIKWLAHTVDAAISSLLVSALKSPVGRCIDPDLRDAVVRMNRSASRVGKIAKAVGV